ncbi:hypothetical protein FD19_GL000750 [Lacticaseibacillus thailandensis DSM 22698 = JCM 13996]|uniref:Uncharacterized protein n=1 Tax=Lacticaseibacillus thailandensis DSM 22698 = JCM 13996 TaxID=1423810 RepID=A0A0R2CEM8_9LACO|nr:hypothetical protein FD19_GL000750 [Lacticaseibacillus thailandensis DSM 22698 = JCM 13996]
MHAWAYDHVNYFKFDGVGRVGGHKLRRRVGQPRAHRHVQAYPTTPTVQKYVDADGQGRLYCGQFKTLNWSREASK